MTDHDALLSAICAEPDEDTPRLAFADFLEENDEPQRAAFIRTQIELARTPAWEPFAVMCRWHRPDLITGQQFRHTLPAVDGLQIEWPRDAFQRGLPWRVNLRTPHVWQHVEQQFLGRIPIGEMHLWTATLDQWREFGHSPIVRQLRKVHFHQKLPNEPLRVLRGNPAALGITDVHFEQATAAGLPFVIEELLASPLGRVIRGFHFRMGYQSLDDLIESLAPANRLERLSMDDMGLTDYHIHHLCGGPLIRSVEELSLRGNQLGSEGVRVFASSFLSANLKALNLSGTGAAGTGIEGLTSTQAMQGLRRLDLSYNPVSPKAARLLSRSPFLSGLRSLNLSKCRIGERELFHLTRGKFWKNLVELDLRDNPLSRSAVCHLLDAAVPADLTALVLTDVPNIGMQSRQDLRQKYGERLVFASS